jgi:hypothetical protein
VLFALDHSFLKVLGLPLEQVSFIEQIRLQVTHLPSLVDNGPFFVVAVDASQVHLQEEVIHVMLCII